MILTLFNPLDTMTHVTLLPSDKENDHWDTGKVDKLDNLLSDAIQYTSTSILHTFSAFCSGGFVCCRTVGHFSKNLFKRTG